MRRAQGSILGQASRTDSQPAAITKPTVARPGRSRAQRGLEPGPSLTAQIGPESIWLTSARMSGVCHRGRGPMSQGSPRPSGHQTGSHRHLFGTIKAGPTFGHTELPSQDSENHRPQDCPLRPGPREGLGRLERQCIPRTTFLVATEEARDDTLWAE